MSARLRELLEEWPDNPLLVQLAAIADRLLALPLAAPLKQVGTQPWLASSPPCAYSVDLIFSYHITFFFT